MKILVVGAGLYGAVLARALAEKGHRIHLIENGTISLETALIMSMLMASACIATARIFSHIK